MEKAKTISKIISFEVMPARFVQVLGDVHILAKTENIAADLAILILVTQIMAKMNTMNILELNLVGPEGGDVEEGNLLVVITNVGSTSIATNMV